MARELAGVHGEINDVLSNVKKVSEDFSKKKNEAIELNELMQDDHSKFLKIMGVRAKAIQSILIVAVRVALRRHGFARDESLCFGVHKELCVVHHITCQFVAIM